MLAHKTNQSSRKRRKQHRWEKEHRVSSDALSDPPHVRPIAKSSERRKTDRQTPQQPLGWQEKMMLKTANKVEKASQSHVDLYELLPPSLPCPPGRNSVLHTGLLAISPALLSGWTIYIMRTPCQAGTLHKRLIVSRCLHKIRVNDCTSSFFIHRLPTPTLCSEWKCMVYTLSFRDQSLCFTSLHFSWVVLGLAIAFLITLRPTTYLRCMQSRNFLSIICEQLLSLWTQAPAYFF